MYEAHLHPLYKHLDIGALPPVVSSFKYTKCKHTLTYTDDINVYVYIYHIGT